MSIIDFKNQIMTFQTPMTRMYHYKLTGTIEDFYTSSSSNFMQIPSFNNSNKVKSKIITTTTILLLLNSYKTIKFPKISKRTLMQTKYKHIWTSRMTRVEFVQTFYPTPLVGLERWETPFKNSDGGTLLRMANIRSWHFTFA